MTREHDSASPAPSAVRVRTTITLPREIHQRVRVRAIERGLTMEAIIEAAILVALAAEGAR